MAATCGHEKAPPRFVTTGPSSLGDGALPLLHELGLLLGLLLRGLGVLGDALLVGAPVDGSCGERRGELASQSHGGSPMAAAAEPHWDAAAPQQVPCPSAGPASHRRAGGGRRPRSGPSGPS